MGLHQIGTTHADSYSTAQHMILQMVLRSLNTGRMIVFAGCGLSRPFGYPGWRELLLALRQKLLDPPYTPDGTDGALDVGLLLEELAHYDDTLAGTAVHARPHSGSRTSIQDELSAIIHEYGDKSAPPESDGLFRNGKAIIGILHKKLGIKRRFAAEILCSAGGREPAQPTRRGSARVPDTTHHVEAFRPAASGAVSGHEDNGTTRVPCTWRGANDRYQPATEGVEKGTGCS